MSWFKPNVKKMEAKRNIQDLIKALGYQKDEEVRAEAASALGNIGDVNAVAPLITALKDDSFFVRKAAAYALGQIGDEHAVEPLAAALKDERFHAQKAAVYALEQIGTPQAQRLVAEYREQEEKEHNRKMKEAEEERKRQEKKAETKRPIKRIFILVNRRSSNSLAFAQEVLTNMPRKYLDELEEGDNKIFVWEMGELDFYNYRTVSMALWVEYSSVFNTMNAPQELPSDKLTFAAFEATMGIKGCVVAQLV